MNRQQLLTFIRESRKLIRGASPEKKIKVLKLIKEAKQKYEQSLLEAAQSPVTESVEQPTNSSENPDYLEEK